MDVAGNTETYGTRTLSIDTVAPVTTVTSSPAPNAAGWNHEPVTLTFAGSDTTSGVRTTEHSLDGGVSWSAGTSVVITNPGVTQVMFTSADHAGNHEVPRVQTVRIDASAPVASVRTTPAPNAAGWHKGNVTVTLSAGDDLSGAAQRQYRQSGAAEWTTYAQPFVVSGNGTKIYEYRSIDLAGNVGAVQSLTLRVDATRPTAKALADCSVRRGGRATLRLRINDGVSPQASVTVKVFKGRALKKTLELGLRSTNAEVRYSFGCGLARGRYTWKVYATDLAGNPQSRVGYRTLTVR